MTSPLLALNLLTYVSLTPLLFMLKIIRRMSFLRGDYSLLNKPHSLLSCLTASRETSVTLFMYIVVELAGSPGFSVV